MTDEILSTSAAIDPVALVDRELMPIVQMIQQMTAGMPPPSIEAMVAGRGAATGVLRPQAETPVVVERVIAGPAGAPDLTIFIVNGQAGASKPGILHMHGGGYVGGTAKEYLGHVQEIAEALDCVIVTVEYRLAPETPYPGSLEDNYTALLWTYAHADEIGLDRARLAIMGESAGGGHAAALAVAARDRGDVPILLQVLIYPMLDDRTGATSPVPDHIGSLVWTSASNRIGWTALLGHAPGGTDTAPGAAVARVKDLAGLPPTFIAVGGLDLFVEEDLVYATRLINAGVPTELYVAPGAFHAFDLVAPEAAIAKAFTGAKLGAFAERSAKRADGTASRPNGVGVECLLLLLRKQVTRRYVLRRTWERFGGAGEPARDSVTHREANGRALAGGRRDVRLTDAAPVSAVRSAAALALLGLTAGLAIMAIYMFNALQESAKADMRLSDFDLSLIQGVALAVPLSLFAIPFGALADRVNRMRLLVAMVVMLALATAAVAYAPSLWLIFTARVAAATAASAMLTIAISLAADFSAPLHRGRAMLVVNVGKILGSAAAFAIGAALTSHFATAGIPRWFGATAPWRATHITVALAACVLALVLLLLAEPARRETLAGPRAPFSALASEIWQRRAYLAPLLIGQVGIVMADTSATIWTTPILSRTYGLKPVQFAGWIALTILAAGILGSLVGGAAADLGHRSRIRGGIILGAVIASAIAVPAALFPVMPGVPALATSLAVFLFCGTVAGLALTAVITVDLPNEIRGLAFGSFLAVGGLIGYGVTPTLVSLVSGAMGGEGHLATALALVGASISALVFLCFVLAMRAGPTAVAFRPEAGVEPVAGLPKATR